MLAERADNPALAAATATQLQAALDADASSSGATDSSSSGSGSGGSLRHVMTALARPTRIVRSKPVDASVRVDASKFEHEEERQLARAYQEAAGKLAGRGADDAVGIGEFLEVAGALVGPIDAFFEKVFVMCEDEGVQRNRLALLRDVAGITRGVVDLSQLPGF